MKLKIELIRAVLLRLSDIESQRRVWLGIGNDRNRPNYDISSLQEDEARLYIDSGLHHFFDKKQVAFSSDIDEKIKSILELISSPSLLRLPSTEEDLAKPEMIEIRRIAGDALADIEANLQT